MNVKKIWRGNWGGIIPFLLAFCFFMYMVLYQMFIEPNYRIVENKGTYRVQMSWALGWRDALSDYDSLEKAKQGIANKKRWAEEREELNKCTWKVVE